MAPWLLGLAPPLVLALGGCPNEPNDCTTAQSRIDHAYDSCGFPPGGAIDSKPTVACEGGCTEAQGEAAQCIADCVEAAACDGLGGVGGGADPDADAAYQACLDACAPSTCAVDPTDTGGADSSTGAGMTTTTPMSTTSGTSADDSGTSSGSGDSGTTGGGPTINVPLGEHLGTSFPVGLYVLQFDGDWAAMIASSAAPVFVNLSTDTVIETLSIAEAAGGGIAGGAPSAFSGVRGLSVATATGGSWSPMTAVPGAPDAWAFAMVPSPSGGPSERVCAASHAAEIACVDAVGTDWVLDPASATDAMWAANCVTFTTGGVAVVDDWALLSSGSSKLCHGQLGAGAQATEIPGIGGLDIECPGNAVGEAKVCGVLAYDATLSTLYWDSPSAAPVLVESVPICAGAEKMEGRVSDDGSEVLFAAACDSADEAHLVTASAVDGSVVGHSVYPVPGCGGKVAALPTIDRQVIGCNGFTLVTDTAKYTPM